MKNLLRLAIVACMLVTAFVVTPADHAYAASTGDFLGRINSLRASKGLGALSIDGRLSGVAQGWAQQMASKNAISHNPALGSIPGDWTKVGENVGTGPDSGAIFNALVASPGHYKNMVDPAFNSIGIGIATGSDGRIYTTHDFAAYPRAAAPSASSGTPSKSAPPATQAPRTSAPAPKSAPKPAAQPKPTPTTAASQPVKEAQAPPAEQPPAEQPPAEAAPTATPSAQIAQGASELTALNLQG